MITRLTAWKVIKVAAVHLLQPTTTMPCFQPPKSLCWPDQPGHILCRLHLYGDIYSSPGLSLRQKQLLMCAFLGEANMPDQLFGHLIAVRGPAVSAQSHYPCVPPS